MSVSRRTKVLRANNEMSYTGLACPEHPSCETTIIRNNVGLCTDCLKGSSRQPCINLFCVRCGNHDPDKLVHVPEITPEGEFATCVTCALNPLVNDERLNVKFTGMPARASTYDDLCVAAKATDLFSKNGILCASKAGLNHAAVGIHWSCFVRQRHSADQDPFRLCLTRTSHGCVHCQNVRKTVGIDSRLLLLCIAADMFKLCVEPLVTDTTRPTDMTLEQQIIVAFHKTKLLGAEELCGHPSIRPIVPHGHKIEIDQALDAIVNAARTFLRWRGHNWVQRNIESIKSGNGAFTAASHRRLDARGRADRERSERMRVLRAEHVDECAHETRTDVLPCGCRRKDNLLVDDIRADEICSNCGVVHTASLSAVELGVVDAAGIEGIHDGDGPASRSIENRRGRFYLNETGNSVGTQTIRAASGGRGRRVTDSATATHDQERVFRNLERNMQEACKHMAGHLGHMSHSVTPRTEALAYYAALLHGSTMRSSGGKNTKVLAFAYWAELLTKTHEMDLLIHDKVPPTTDPALAQDMPAFHRNPSPEYRRDVFRMIRRAQRQAICTQSFYATCSKEGLRGSSVMCRGWFNFIRTPGGRPHRATMASKVIDGEVRAGESVLVTDTVCINFFPPPGVVGAKRTAEDPAARRKLKRRC